MFVVNGFFFRIIMCSKFQTYFLERNHHRNRIQITRGRYNISNNQMHLLTLHDVPTCTTIITGFKI